MLLHSTDRSDMASFLCSQTNTRELIVDDFKFSGLKDLTTEVFEARSARGEYDFSAPSSPASSTQNVPSLESSPCSSPASSPEHCLDFEYEDFSLDSSSFEEDCSDTLFSSTHDNESIAEINALQDRYWTPSCSDCGSSKDDHLDFCMNAPSKFIKKSFSVSGTSQHCVMIRDPFISEVVSNIPSVYPWKLSNIYPNNECSLLNTPVDESAAFKSSVTPKPQTADSSCVPDASHLNDHCYGNTASPENTDKSCSSDEDMCDTTDDSGDEIDVVGLPDDKSRLQDLSFARSSLKRPHFQLHESYPSTSRKLARTDSYVPTDDWSMPTSDCPERKVKRSQHNHMERQRRNDIKSLFLHLRDSVPESTSNPRASKLTILNNGRKFIQNLNHMATVLERQEREMKNRQIRLIQLIAKYPEGRKLLNIQNRRPETLLK